MPKLWSETIESHRRDVRDAVMDTTAALVAEHGLRAVTMSQIAEGAGIGRATLYKYFPDVDSILVAWHDRQVTAHLQGLAELGHGAGDPGERLAAVLESYALMSHEVASAHHGTDLVALIHSPQHITHAQHQLDQLVRDLIAEAARLGIVRDDVAPGELATYCLSALSATPGQSSKAAVSRLVRVTLTGLRADPDASQSPSS